MDLSLPHIPILSNLLSTLFIRHRSFPLRRARETSVVSDIDQFGRNGAFRWSVTHHEHATSWHCRLDCNDVDCWPDGTSVGYWNNPLWKDRHYSQHEDHSSVLEIRFASWGWGLVRWARSSGDSMLLTIRRLGFEAAEQMAVKTAVVTLPGFSGRCFPLPLLIEYGLGTLRSIALPYDNNWVPSDSGACACSFRSDNTSPSWLGTYQLATILRYWGCRSTNAVDLSHWLCSRSLPSVYV